jgi:glycosyltransferase involved in cell wall biosynthesis
MKILLISHAPNDENGGASRVYHLLSRALKAQGHEVTLYHYEDLRVPRFINFLVKRMAIPEFVYLRFSREAAAGYDVIFCSNGMAHHVYRKLRGQAHRPYLIHHLHGLSYFGYLSVVTERLRGHVKRGPLFMALKKCFAIRWDAKGARYADVIVTQNLRDRDYIEDQRDQLGASAGAASIVQVPAALHPRIAEAGQKAAPPEQRDSSSILWFGSWVERKGNAYVNRAFREVKAQFPDATLTLWGTGVCESVIQSHFDPELRSSLRVVPRIDIETQLQEYKTHGLFIFPSLSEGFGLALIEAMCMGLACVTTPTGFAGDWIEDREHAIVVPTSSSVHLARGIVRLMRDKALRCHVARTGQQLAAGFTLERSIREYLQVLEKRTTV